MSGHQRIAGSIEVDSHGTHATRLDRSDLPIRFELLERFRCIELILFWEGLFRTNVLTHFYGLSRSRATKDIGEYLQHNPSAMEYSTQFKAYEVTPQFRPVFTKCREDEYSALLYRNKLWSDSITSLEIETPGLNLTTFPSVHTERHHFMAVLRAIRWRRKLIVYHMGERDGRVHSLKDQVKPLRMIQTHRGWLVRAEVRKDGIKNIPLNRFLQEPEFATGFQPVEDPAWELVVYLEASLREDLDFDERALASMDWGIRPDQVITHEVREPLADILADYWQAIEPRFEVRISMFARDEPV